MRMFKNRKANEKKETEQSSEVFSNSEKKEKFEQLSLESKIPTENQDTKEKNKRNSENLTVYANPPDEKEQLEEAEEAVKSQNSKKKKWMSLLGLLINLIVVAGILTYQLTKEDMKVSSFSTLLSNIHWGIFVLLILLFCFIMFLESSKFWLVIYKTCKTNRPALSYKTAALGKYYDSITPLASGGQPFQILYMNKRGLSGSQALSVCMGKYVIQQIAYIVFALIIMIFSITIPSDNVGATVVTATSWVGFALNAFLIFIVALISINKTIGDKLVLGVLKLLHKIKIVKNYDKQYSKIQKVVNDYQSTMKKYAKEKGTFFSMLGISFLYLFAYYCVPFLIHASFYGFHFELFGQIFIYCVMVDLAASFFPLPGGTGASELSFSVLFATLFGVEGNLFWALLIWRFFTYYIYLIQGLGLTIYDYLVGNKKFEWTKRRWSLEAESREFEEKELKDFELSLNKKNKVKRRKEK